MPLPKWLASLNKRTFNKLELKRGVRPVLTHVGRSSGKTYETPLDAHPIDDGYIFIINYGRGSDWVQNIMAAGTATLTVGGEVVELGSPRIVAKEEARSQLQGKAKALPGFVNEVLKMDVRR